MIGIKNSFIRIWHGDIRLRHLLVLWLIHFAIRMTIVISSSVDVNFLDVNIAMLLEAANKEKFINSIIHLPFAILVHAGIWNRGTTKMRIFCIISFASFLTDFMPIRLK